MMPAMSSSMFTKVHLVIILAVLTSGGVTFAFWQKKASQETEETPEAARGQ